MFQSFFHLPVPRVTDNYLHELLDPSDVDFKACFQRLFNFDLSVAGNWKTLTKALDENLPHNPRKIKSFVNSWKLYIESLPDPPAGQPLYWRLTMVLHYLAQFEEPLFRKVEENPAFYADHIARFCRRAGGWATAQEYQPHRLFDGLEMPHRLATQPPILAEDTGGISPTPAIVPNQPAGEKKDTEAAKKSWRTFWIARLVLELERDAATLTIDEPTILRHLLHTGDCQPQL